MMIKENPRNSGASTRCPRPSPPRNNPGGHLWSLRRQRPGQLRKALKRAFPVTADPEEDVANKSRSGSQHYACPGLLVCEAYQKRTDSRRRVAATAATSRCPAPATTIAWNQDVQLTTGRHEISTATPRTPRQRRSPPSCPRPPEPLPVARTAKRQVAIAKSSSTSYR